MKNLNETWVTDGMIDFEYKKYLLLGYLKQIRSKFSQAKLYPYLSDLILHYNNLIILRSNKQKWAEGFPKKLKGIDTDHQQLLFESMIADEPLMKEINDILEFAQDEMKLVVKDGAELYEHVEQNVSISPIGIIPIQNNEGYIFLHQTNKLDYAVYRYSTTIFEKAKEKYRGIKTTFVRRVTYSRFVTLESEKLKLTREFNSWPNPATYYVTTTESFPEKETFFPVTKRYLVKYLSEDS